MLVVAGCSGINASKSVSPIDFLLPHKLLMLQESPPAPPDSVLLPGQPACLIALN
jgi:hypothetical protein